MLKSYPVIRSSSSCGWKSPSVFCTLILLASCNGGGSSGGGGGEVVTTAPSAPSSLSLAAPLGSPGSNPTPTISVSGVVSGNTVKLFSDSACATEIGSAVSSGTSVNVTVNSALAFSLHTIYANATNVIGTSPCSNSSVSYKILDCPSGFIPVGHNTDVGTTSDFCVMKYEAKAYHSVNQTIDADGCNEAGCTTANWGLADHYPKSSQTGLPWIRISITNASAECNSLNSINEVSNKYDLISNSEWMTIARNAEIQDINWDTGSAGSGAMFRGHSDSSTLQLEAGADNDPYFGTGNTDLGVMGEGKEQKRTLTLSNGGIIWDFSGNLWEWVDWSVDTGVQQGPSDCPTSWIELRDVSCNDLSETQFMPFLMNLISTDGIGQFKGGSSTGRATLRGGAYYDGLAAGIYSLFLFYPIGRQDLYSGFRCVYRP